MCSGHERVYTMSVCHVRIKGTVGTIRIGAQGAARNPGQVYLTLGGKGLSTYSNTQSVAISKPLPEIRQTARSYSLAPGDVAT